MKMVIEGEKELEISLEKPKKILDILKELNLDPNQYVIIKNGEIVGEWEEVKEGDNLELIPVISGG